MEATPATAKQTFSSLLQRRGVEGFGAMLVSAGGKYPECGCSGGTPSTCCPSSPQADLVASPASTGGSEDEGSEAPKLPVLLGRVCLAARDPPDDGLAACADEPDALAMARRAREAFLARRRAVSSRQP